MLCAFHFVRYVLIVEIKVMVITLLLIPFVIKSLFSACFVISLYPHASHKYKYNLDVSGDKKYLTTSFFLFLLLILDLNLPA